MLGFAAIMLITYLFSCMMAMFILMEYERELLKNKNKYQHSRKNLAGSSLVINYPVYVNALPHSAHTYRDVRESITYSRHVNSRGGAKAIMLSVKQTDIVLSALRRAEREAKHVEINSGTSPLWD